MGVKTLYLNPIFEAASNHRYDTSDYMKIDPFLGDEKDFAELIDCAKKLGIRVILDGVFNHCGSFNKWMDREHIYDKNPNYLKGAFVSKESQ